MSGERPAEARLARFVPAVSWLPRYQRGWLPSYAIAGFTIWGLLIPEMIAYASLAGLPLRRHRVHADHHSAYPAHAQATKHRRSASPRPRLAGAPWPTA